MQEPATNQTFKYPTGSEAKGAITAMMKCSCQNMLCLSVLVALRWFNFRMLKRVLCKARWFGGSCELIQDWRGGKVDKVTHGYRVGPPTTASSVTCKTSR